MPCLPWEESQAGRILRSRKTYGVPGITGIRGNWAAIKIGNNLPAKRAFKAESFVLDSIQKGILV